MSGIYPEGDRVQAAIEAAVMAKGRKNQWIQRDRFFEQLARGTNTPTGVKIDVQHLPTDRILVVYEDARVAPIRTGFRNYAPISRVKGYPVEITWETQFQDGQLWHLPELDLHLETRDSQDSDHSVKFGALVLEVLGYMPVNLGVDLTGFVWSGEIRAPELHRLTDNFCSSPIIVTLDDAIGWAESYLNALRERKANAVSASDV